jgi:DnaJ domain
LHFSYNLCAFVLRNSTSSRASYLFLELCFGTANKQVNWTTGTVASTHETGHHVEGAAEEGVPCQRRPVSANEKQIKQAYRTLAKKYHTDKNKSDPRAETKFIEITRAYDALMSLDKHAYADHDYNNNTTQQQRLQYRR